jgi:arylformamidase
MSVTQIVASARRAMIAIRREASMSGAIFVSGHSAGGHLAAMMLATDWATLGVPDLTIAGAMPVSGLFDLEPLYHVALNDTLCMTLPEARAQSPIALRANPAAQVLAVVGAAETAEFRRQTSDYAATIGHAETLLVSGANHFTVMGELADPLTAAGRRMVDFVRG